MLKWSLKLVLEYHINNQNAVKFIMCILSNIVEIFCLIPATISRVVIMTCLFIFFFLPIQPYKPESSSYTLPPILFPLAIIVLFFSHTGSSKLLHFKIIAFPGW